MAVRLEVHPDVERLRHRVQKLNPRVGARAFHAEDVSDVRGGRAVGVRGLHDAHAQGRIERVDGGASFEQVRHARRHERGDLVAVEEFRRAVVIVVLQAKVHEPVGVAVDADAAPRRSQRVEPAVRGRALLLLHEIRAHLLVQRPRLPGDVAKVHRQDVSRGRSSDGFREGGELRGAHAVGAVHDDGPSFVVVVRSPGDHATEPAREPREVIRLGARPSSMRRVHDVVELRGGHEPEVGDGGADGLRAGFGRRRERRAGGPGVPREEDVRRGRVRGVCRGMRVLREVRLGGRSHRRDRGSHRVPPRSVGERLRVPLPRHREHPTVAVDQLDAVVALGVVARGDHDAGGAAGHRRSHRRDRSAAEHGGREHVAPGAEAGGAVGEPDGRAVGGRRDRVRVARRDEGVDVHVDAGACGSRWRSGERLDGTIWWASRSRGRSISSFLPVATGDAVRK